MSEHSVHIPDLPSEEGIDRLVGLLEPLARVVQPNPVHARFTAAVEQLAKWPMQPIFRGVGLRPLPRPERLYFWFGEPIDTTRYARRRRRRDADAAARALRDEVRAAVEGRHCLPPRRARPRPHPPPAPPTRRMTLALAARAERWRVPAQTGAAAGLSWWIATSAAGHAAPLSAPVVAVIAIGATTGGRARRTIDVILGLTIGIAFATLLVSTFGRSAPLLALVVAAAMLTARATRGGDVLMTQAGIAAILVFATQHDGTTSAALARIADALIGGTSAAVVSLFVFPPNPVRLLLARFHALHSELAGVLDDTAHGLRTRDGDRVAAALDRARATDELVDALHETRAAAAEIARFVPARRGTRDLVARLDSASVPLDHAIRNTRVIARAALSLLSADHAVRHGCAGATAMLAEAVRKLDPSQRDERVGHERARQAAYRLAVLHAQNPSPALGAVAAASRGIADDLASVQSI